MLPLLALAVAYFPNGTAGEVVFGPFLLAPAATVPETFLSFNLDWNLNASAVDAWTNASVATIDLHDPRLRSLTAALAPANLRVGGSNADLAVYDASFRGGEDCPPEAVEKKVCLSAARWDAIVDFAEATGLRLVFCLNMMAGRGADGRGEWDGANARALLEHTARRHPRFKHGFQLGNEKEYVIEPGSAARAFVSLRAMVDALWPAGDRPLVVGPDMNPRPDWLALFLRELPEDTLDAVSYHLYPGYGRSLDLPTKMLLPGWLGFGGEVMAAVKGVHDRSRSRSAQLWITETAAAWASGTAGVCDGFISGFWWLDQLGQAASSGHGAMCRQCLVGGNYSLLDQLHGFRPNPDWWSAWIWRQLVGTTQLAMFQVMPFMGDFDPEVRGTLFCTARTAPRYAAGSVTFVYVNLASAPRRISMYQQARMAAVPPPFANGARTEYILTPGDEGELLSRRIRLNGAELAAGPNATLPRLHGVPGRGDWFVVPPQSYGFAVYAAQAAACL